MRKIEYIILHHSATSSLESIKNAFMNKNRKVSSHYVVDKNGDIYQFVEEKNKAYHAGISAWSKDRDINTKSIGIEIVNEDGNINKYQSKQIDSVIQICLNIIKKSGNYNIKHFNILGHSDISVGRKIDPGILFPWDFLSQHDIGVYASEEECEKYKQDNGKFYDKICTEYKTSIKFILSCLELYGYNSISSKTQEERHKQYSLAFNRHFGSNLSTCLDKIGILKLLVILSKTSKLDKAMSLYYSLPESKLSKKSEPKIK